MCKQPQPTDERAPLALQGTAVSGHRRFSWFSILVLSVGTGACGHGAPQVPATRVQELAARAAPSNFEDLEPARPRQRLRDGRSGVTFVRVEPGEFAMGGGMLPPALPKQRVRLTQALLVAETEVTVAQWRRFLAESGARDEANAPGAPADHPATVTFMEAQSYCGLYGYRLPTEAEWEYCCRGGQELADGPWHTDSGLAEVAWYHLNAGQHAMPVRTRRPNPYGLYDMLGNVWEWCSDWHYDPAKPPDLAAPMPQEVAVDPQGPPTGTSRALRGGSWFTVPGPKPFHRLFDGQVMRSAVYGFRPVRLAE
jgi:formylglycine-generating enzyme required for sulfatase activity